MNADFIKTYLQEAVYSLKEGTTSSYYWQSGARLLPNRLSITKGAEMTHVQRKGRNLLDPIVGQLIGKYTKAEASTLKRFPPFHVRTQIWKKAEFPLLIGYGTTGISSPEGIVDTHDLLAFYSNDSWQTLRIFFFHGLGVPNYIEEAMAVAQELVTM